MKSKIELDYDCLEYIMVMDNLKYLFTYRKEDFAIDNMNHVLKKPRTTNFDSARKRYIKKFGN